MYWTDLYFKLKIVVPLVFFGIMAVMITVAYLWDWYDRRKGRPF